ncbi:hypothetical protein [Streptomyces sp. SAJ15]|uniref:hypothetical protein n=1 Tax=Streptomyces sp. SAJ15 TaxID=2011095 RepID=UPI00164307ED|nr:hypothetical protein [Streptomyces sp. SAJ15]
MTRARARRLDRRHDRRHRRSPPVGFRRPGVAAVHAERDLVRRRGASKVRESGSDRAE